jgi:predicted Zn-dependent protease
VAKADELYKHEEGGVQFTIPKGWHVEEDGDLLTVSTPDEELSMFFYIPEDDDFDAAIKGVADALDEYIKNIKFTEEGKQSTHNGMKSYEINGTGEYEGQKVVWDLTVLAAKKPLFVVTVAAPDKLAKHAAQYETLAKSVKKY